MKFKDIQKLSDVKFRRLTGVSWATFNLMLAELNKQLAYHIEDTLIRSGKFNLPKQLPNRDEVDWEVVVIDATEILVQRPKKTEEMV